MRDGWPAGVPRGRELQTILVAAHPWLQSDDVGPRAVEAGECDRCRSEPRLVETCGPDVERYLGRRCARAEGLDAWCEGHREQAGAALAVLDRLDDTADDVARAWWLATGEVRLTPAAGDRLLVRVLPPASVPRDG